MRSAYVDALCREIRTFGGRRGANEASRGNEKIRVDTVFLGGGTPSVMDPADLTRVMETVRETFDVLPGA
jgi:oxygen-independent coproporphyrinogen-3 oxidase